MKCSLLVFACGVLVLLLTSACGHAGSTRWCRAYRQKMVPFENARSPELWAKLEKMQIKYVSYCSEVDPAYAQWLQTRPRYYPQPYLPYPGYPPPNSPSQQP